MEIEGQNSKGRIRFNIHYSLVSSAALLLNSVHVQVP